MPLHKRTKKIVVVSIFFCAFLFFITPTAITLANEAEVKRLENQIQDLSGRLRAIDEEIRAAQSKVAETSAEAATISSRVKSLEASRRKIETDISYTETEIERSQLEIEKLSYEITDKQVRINKNTEVLAENIRQMEMLDSMSFIETLLAYQTMSDFWNHVQAIQSFQNKIQETLHDLRDLNVELLTKKDEETNEQKKLELSKRLLSGEREAVASTKSEEEKLLRAAKNEELTYREILAQKQREKEQFEAALLEFESQLQTLIDPTTFPNPRHGVLSWPADNIRITQQFGGTQFAKNNPHIYGRGMHNGTDFGMPIGTKIYAVLDGTVQATGNTDAYPGCVSWGKWVLIKHPNGLSTLYAHLSSILVTPGESVERGQTIALSGNTGYSTGPHLHLTLYASQGVEVVQFNQFKAGGGCAATGAATPVAPLEAYLDPMKYLPAL